MQKRLTGFIIAIIALSNLFVGFGVFIISQYYTRSLRTTIIEDAQQQIASRLGVYDLMYKMVEEDIDSNIDQRLPNLAKDLQNLDKPLSRLTDDEMKAIANRYRFDDLYLINSKGIVIKTTYEPDQYFRLFSISDNFKGFLMDLYGSGIVKTERISISSRTGMIKKFSYFSPKGSDFIIEVSIDVKKYIDKRYPANFRDYINGKIFYDIPETTKHLIELDLYAVNDVGQWSLVNEGQKMDPEIYMLAKSGQPFTRVRDNLNEMYQPIQARFTNSPILRGQLWMKSVYDFSSINFQRRKIFFVLLGITLLSIIVTYYIVSWRIKKNIISRILQINRALNHIANGSRSEVLDISQNDELTKIAQNIQFMQAQIREKEKIIIEINDALEQKVEQRTTALSQEIENHMRTEDLLRDAILTSEAANRSKSEFLANVSHELQTPLNAVIGFTEIMLEEEEKNEKIHKLSTIHSAAIQLMSIVKNILDYSRIESNSLRVDSHIMNLPQTLRSTFGLLHEQAKEKGIAYDIEIHRDVPEIAYGDSGRIRQIIWNLLSNAIKFTPAGRVDMACCYKDGWLIVDVTDTGIGIQEKDRDKIFDAFEQVSKSTTRRYSGTGLGLAISQRLAEIMKGSITFESVPGKGTTFTFKVLVKPPNKTLGL